MPLFRHLQPVHHPVFRARSDIRADDLPVLDQQGRIVRAAAVRVVRDLVDVARQLLPAVLQQVYDRGFRTFLCGMARGCDQYFAEAVLACRAAGTAPEAILTAMVPCPSQKDGWPAEEQARYDVLLAACSAVEVLEPVYTPGCMLRRNRAMVQRASLLISVFDGTPGGTASTLRFAAKQGIEILPLWM